MKRTTIAWPRAPRRCCIQPDIASTSQTASAVTATAIKTITGGPGRARAAKVIAAMIVPGPAMSGIATGTMS